MGWLRARGGRQSAACPFARPRRLTVLVVDNDPQGNASTAWGVEHTEGTPSVYDILVDGMPMSDTVQDCPDVPGLRCVPATRELSGLPEDWTR